MPCQVLCGRLLVLDFSRTLLYVVRVRRTQLLPLRSFLSLGTAKFVWFSLVLVGVDG